MTIGFTNSRVAQVIFLILLNLKGKGINYLSLTKWEVSEHIVRIREFATKFNIALLCD